MQLTNLVTWTEMTQRQISDKKRAIPVFDIRNQVDNTVYGSGTKTNELSIVFSEQSYRRSGKRIRTGFLPWR